MQLEDKKRLKTLKRRWMLVTESDAERRGKKRKRCRRRELQTRRCRGIEMKRAMQEENNRGKEREIDR